MFDVFYSGTKPGLFPHEQPADSIAHAQQLSGTRYFWWINYLTDYTGFDFLYEPVPWQSGQRHAWASQWQKDAGTYLVPKHGYAETHYRVDHVLQRLPDRSPWTIPDTFDLDSFDFSWHPDPTEPGYIYQFGTQHQRTGGPEYHIPGATDLKFCDQVRGSVKSGITPVVEINHMDGNAGQVVDVTKTVRYFDNYKDTLTRIANTVDAEYVWIISSVCDYANFDFSWHPELWQNTMLHVFASNGEKFGDTFYMHVPSFRTRIGQFDLLDWYDLNFVGPGVPRRPLPVITHDFDTHVEAIRTQDWPGPLAVFSVDGNIQEIPTVALWREKTKTVVPLSPGASNVIVPKAAVPYIKTQTYDYPHIDRTQRHMYTDEPLDIVFIDNGEFMADYNWLQLPQTSIPNQIHRSSGVNGRVAAYQAAAKLSTTPWFFAVFAKLRVSAQFDWAWQPDRLQEPKHYIFHAYNPVTGLTYGHQAAIAYNKQLVLANDGVGLDFTLDSAHEVVPVVSGTAEYAISAWVAWRTAFRECIKLAGNTDVESQYRLNKWLTVNLTGDLDYGEYSMLGAQDAVEYYEAVAGDVTELRKSYDWTWLATYAMLKRNLIPDQ
jgi:hypothetical protein